MNRGSTPDGRYFKILAVHGGSASEVSVWCLGQYENGARRLRGVPPGLAKIGAKIDHYKVQVGGTILEEEALSRERMP